MSSGQIIQFPSVESPLTMEDITGYDPISDEPVEPDVPLQPFDANLADYLSESTLNNIASDLKEKVDDDLLCRDDWEKTYKEHLQYLGLKEMVKTRPWKDACGTVHPGMLEAIVRFQSRASVKLFPAGGPAKLNLDVDMTTQIQKALLKSQKKLNSWIIRKMPELRDETEKSLFAMAQIGCAFKKVHFHPKLKRITSEFVRAEDLIIPYGTGNLEICPRFTERARMPIEQIKSLQRSGEFRDIDLEATAVEDMSEVEEEKAEIVGIEPSFINKDAIRLRLVYVDLYIDDDEFRDMDGGASPYVITIEEGSNHVLAIRRNWEQEDGERRKAVDFVSYAYVPGDGPYAYGLIHLVGQLASGITKILQELIDSGELANIPAFFASNAARMDSQDALYPGEIRRVNLSPDQLKNAFYPIPFKEPSQVLMSLMTLLIEELKVFSSTSDLDISASSQNAPVGTTLALLERQTEVGNAVQMRLHESFRRELEKIIEGMKKYHQDEYQKIFGPILQLLQQAGEDDEAQVYPIGDPTSATMSQRLLQYQSLSTMAQQAPQIFDLTALGRALASAMGIDDVDAIIPDHSSIEPSDPVSENMAIMTGKPVKAFEHQNQQAHISVHTSVLNDPMYQQQIAQDPQGQMKHAALVSHICDHIAFDYRQQIQSAMGVQLPPIGQLPPQQENVLSDLMAKAAPRVESKHEAEAKAKQAQQQAEDGEYQLEKQRLAIDAKEAQDKTAIETRKLDIKERFEAAKVDTERFRITQAAETAEQAHIAKIATEENRDDSNSLKMALDAGQIVLDHHVKTRNPNSTPDQ